MSGGNNGYSEPTFVSFSCSHKRAIEIIKEQNKKATTSKKYVVIDTRTGEQTHVL